MQRDDAEIQALNLCKTIKTLCESLRYFVYLCEITSQ